MLNKIKKTKRIMSGEKMIIKKLLEKFEIKDMNDWNNVNADLVITDPPFGIEFSGKNGNILVIK
ncbi:MAG: hypothetical protein DRP06_04285 [Candidatus Aenigmatarchaeota archaeon]|nr:MAG: hypothetical protein DRP06_04285 [Candidatus Aenigmarchaeota archaeon]